MPDARVADRIDWAFTNALRASQSPPQNPLDPRLIADVVDDVLARADRQRLSVLVLRGLIALGAGEEERPLVAAKEKEALFASMALQHRARHLATVLSEAALVHAFLKGLVSDPLFFGGRGWRGTTDIDLLIARDHVGEAQRILESLGARPFDFPGLEATVDASHGRPWLWPGPGHHVVVDVHTALLDPPLRDFSDDALGTAQDHQTETGTWRGLRAPEWLAYAAGNLAIDGLSGRDKMLLDASALVTHHPAAVAPAGERARAAGVGHGLWALLRLCQVRMGAVLDEGVMQRLSPPAAKARLLEMMYGVHAAPVELRGLPGRLLIPDDARDAARGALRWAGLRTRDIVGSWGRRGMPKGERTI